MSVKFWTFAVGTLLVAAIANFAFAGTQLRPIREAIATQLDPQKTESLEEEIINSISLQLPNLHLDPAVETILAYVVETRKLPADAKLSFASNDVLCLDLCLTETEQAKRGYRLILRHPALKRLDDGTLLLHEKWKPAEHEKWSWNGTAWESTKD